MLFGSNAILDLVDLGVFLTHSFNRLVGSCIPYPWPFGHHTIKVIIHLIEITITKKEYMSVYREKGQSGYRKARILQNETKVSCNDWPIVWLLSSQTNLALPLPQNFLGISSKWVNWEVLRLLVIARYTSMSSLCQI